MFRLHLQLLGVAAALLLVSAACSSTETITTYQAANPPEFEIDGELSGWPTSSANIKRSDEFNFYVMQDEQHLYIYVDFRSPFFHQAIENSGFILYLARSDEERNRRGVGHPVGAFNFLRDDTNAFRSLTRESDWLASPENQQRLESFKEENFDYVAIVDRHDGSRDAQYVFFPYSRIEAQGLEIAVSAERRYYGIEYKIPLSGTPPFDLERGETYWLGFSIEPPEFRFRDDEDVTQFGRRDTRGYYRPAQRSQRSDSGTELRRRMGLYDYWIKIEVE